MGPVDISRHDAGNDSNPGASKPKPDQAACRKTGHKFKAIKPIQGKILQFMAKNQKQSPKITPNRAPTPQAFKPI
jgi:hypothetical protein